MDFEAGQVLLFDKPLYWTSFDLVNKVRIMIRSALGIRKIKTGHAGTLDPLASGLLIICTGRATKRIDEFRDIDKEYVATIRFGETTPSYDRETEVDGRYPVEHINEELVIKVLKGFLGEQKQVPPMHSAKFLEGKRAYEYARKGIEKEMTPVTVHFRLCCLQVDDRDCKKEQDDLVCGLLFSGWVDNHFIPLDVVSG